MRFSIDEMVKENPYSLDKTEKEALFAKAMTDLTAHHYARCADYRRIVGAFGYREGDALTTETTPMLPVRAFKELDLRSVDEENVVKTMTSSGTSGQRVSKIYLDKENTQNQTKTLNSIIGSFIGKKRLPLLILDTKLALKDRAMFSARGAGIVGFQMFGKKVCYALDEEMRLNTDDVREFAQTYADETILLFGYTYMIWQYVVEELRRQGVSLSIASGSLFHIGGWKKLQERAVDEATFNRAVHDALGNVVVHNYYGMAEQLGSVFVECECGNLHCSDFSDIIIRDPFDFSDAGAHKRGLIELQSLLPTSYPGHALLTEDEGEILGGDDCPCGRKGKYFKIYGRVKGAEIRGCSDTFSR